MFQRLLLPLPILILALLLAACSSSADSAGPPPDLVIRINQDGVYRVVIKDLKTFGWDQNNLQGKRIRLLQGDDEVAYQTQDGKDMAILFYGQVTPTRYDDTAAYILQATDDPPAVAMPDLPSQPLTGNAADSFQATVRAEENLTYLAQVRDGDPWVGQRIFAPGQVELTIDTPDPTDGSGQITLALWAATSSPADVDHHLVVMLNGQKLGEDAWDGDGPHQIVMDAPAGSLRPEGNTIAISAPGDTEAKADLVYVNWIEAAYERQTRAQDDRLLFETDAQEVAVSGFDDDPIQLWEVTDPLSPANLTGATASDGVIAYRFAEKDTHKIAAFSPKGFLSPLNIELAPAALTSPEKGADYIVIAHPDLAAAVQPLVALRQAQGLRTAVVPTDQIYLKFGAGEQSAEAITDFLRWAVETWPEPAPRFVLLAGDASYDPRNYLDAPNKNLVPTAFVSTVVMGETASDNALADVDGDGLPDLAIGRFPAQTPDEMKAMVDKTIAYEQNLPPGDWVNQFLFVADDDDPYFNDFNVEMMGLIPDAFTAENLVISPDIDARSELLGKLNEGRGLVSYMGHVLFYFWAK